MGADGAKSVNQSIGLLDHQNVQGYVQGLGMNLASASERAQLPWSFAVLDDPTPDAFAFPGAYVFVTPSLAGLIRNEAALVSVARTRDRPKLIEAKKWTYVRHRTRFSAQGLQRGHRRRGRHHGRTGNELSMTQELIANMLGVRREGVTAAAGKLHKLGIIEYKRGHIRMLDGPPRARKLVLRVLRGRQVREQQTAALLGHHPDWPVTAEYGGAQTRPPT